MKREIHAKNLSILRWPLSLCVKAGLWVGGQGKPHRNGVWGRVSGTEVTNVLVWTNNMVWLAIKKHDLCQSIVNSSHYFFKLYLFLLGVEMDFLRKFHCSGEMLYTCTVVRKMVCAETDIRAYTRTHTRICKHTNTVWFGPCSTHVCVDPMFDHICTLEAALMVFGNENSIHCTIYNQINAVITSVDEWLSMSLDGTIIVQLYFECVLHK